MTMQEDTKNESDPIPVTSVRQLVGLGNRQDPFIFDARFRTIDEILERIPRGTVLLSRERGVFEETLLVRIQVVKPELCGTDDISIQLLNGDPDTKREISRNDEKDLADFLERQGFNEESCNDDGNETCARYFDRTIATSRTIQ